MPDIKNDKDDFWNIDKLVPKKNRKIDRFATDIRIAEHTVSGQADSKSEDRSLSFASKIGSDDLEMKSYSPRSNSLVSRVTIRRFRDRYDFYGNFRKAALLYYDYKAPKCEFTPFYSYLPQYSQLTSAQKNYYFYWRDMVRQGRFIKCDYSYLYLLVYEILNLPDKISPDRGVLLLAVLWREYRASLPRIDGYFAIWIQDYCLIYDLPCPISEISGFIYELLPGIDFKEFYLSDMSGLYGDGTEAMVAYLSDYDWRTSRYAVGEYKEIFKGHMLGAMRRVLMYYSPESIMGPAEAKVLKRDAFTHSLCTHAVKCSLEIEYTSLSQSNELKRAITGAVRYAENKLRALIGVKSRLGIKEIDDVPRMAIDRYFNEIFEVERVRRERESKPEYEKLYDAESRGLSFSDADEIERASWSTTERLVAFDSESTDIRTVSTDGTVSHVAWADKADNPDVRSKDLSAAPPLAKAEIKAAASDSLSEIIATCPQPTVKKDNPLGLSDADLEVVSALVRGCDISVRPDAYERINEAFLDSDVGDVILLECDGGYRLIEDYREDVKDLLGI